MDMQSSQVFDRYAKYYDMLYSDKDYEKECDVLEDIFRAYCARKPLTILDAGCGTGNHAISLRKRGFRVTGIDGSEQMIRIAREKARMNQVDVDFRVMKLANLTFEERFDACICMFAVLGYLTSNEELGKALKNIRQHLRANSIFILDFWYGPAVLAMKPSSRSKVVEKNDTKVIRTVSAELNVLNQTCVSNYYLVAIKDRVVVDEVRESHAMRFFFPQELAYVLQAGGFRLLKLCEFLNLEAEPTERTWNAMAIASAI